MKKLFILLLLAALIIPGAQAASMQHVADQSDKFSAEQIRALEDRMQAIYDTYSFDTVIVTTNDSRGQTAQMFAADFYDEFRSYDDYPNGLIFSFNFDLGDYYEAARGIGMVLFSDQGADALDKLLRPSFDNRDYYGAMTVYLDSIEKQLSLYSQPGEDGKMIVSTTRRLPTFSESMQSAAGLLPFLLIIGVIIGFVSASAMRGKMNLARPQSGARSYAAPDSLRLHDSSEIYLYQTVTRTKIQDNKSSGGGSSGGGSRYSSSSGGSYGGRGGKL